MLSSDTYLREAMRATAVSLDEARSQARARIHRKEMYDPPNEDGENEDAPDLPAPINNVPWTIIRRQDDTRRMVATGTVAGSGELLITCAVLLPAELVINQADDSAEVKAAKHSGAIEWATRLADTIREELILTKGAGSVDGNPYLNALDIKYDQDVSFPDDSEPHPNDWMAWVYLVPWN